jgi:FkbM family methyltransferase
MSLRSRILSAFCRRPVRLTPSDWTFVKFHFGQFGEDAVFTSLWDWRRRPQGYYVDVGAYHPIDLSNTNVLYRHGWRGITIDPNPKLAPLFARHRPEGRHVTCAVGPESGEAAYFAFPQANYNTMDEEQARRVGQPFEKLSVPVHPLAHILGGLVPDGQKIDLMSVDCEGMDVVVLESNDWDRFRPEFVMVEDETPAEESPTARLLGAQGYAPVAWLKMTKIYRLREASQS